MTQLADSVSLTVFRVGWRGTRLLPERAAYRMFDLAALAATRRGGTDVQRMRANYALVRPELGAEELEALVKSGMRSYLRYWCDAFRLPDRSPEDLATRVRCENEAAARADIAAGQGLVLFLGHLGNWDTAGAWASCHLAPVTTVAERLKPEELYAEFLAFRESLGMTIFPLTGEGSVFGRLVRAVKGGAFVPLLADRDLTDRGVTVDFCGHRAAMASGPASLALMTGAPLRPTTVRYELIPGQRPGPSAYRIVISFGPQVHDPTVGTKAERIAAMTQQCADYIGHEVNRSTHDWHMMQRVFVP